MALARTVLPVPGHVLDEQVAAAQQRDEGEPDLVVLADDHALDVGEDLVPGFLDLRHRPLSRMGGGDAGGYGTVGRVSGRDDVTGWASVVSADSTSDASLVPATLS